MITTPRRTQAERGFYGIKPLVWYKENKNKISRRSRVVEVQNMEVCCTGIGEAEGGGRVVEQRIIGRGRDGIQTEQREKGYWVSKMFRLSLTAASFRKFQFTIQLVTIRVYTLVFIVGFLGVPPLQPRRLLPPPPTHPVATVPCSDP